MQTLNNAELAFLSALGYPSLTRMVLRLYVDKVIIFQAKFYPHLDKMWTAYTALLDKYRKQYGLSLSRDIIAAGLMEAVQADASLIDDTKARCDTMMARLVAGDIPDQAHGERLIRNLLELDANRKLISKINQNADLIMLQQSLDAYKRVADSLVDDTQETLGMVVNPLRDITKLATKSVRMPTGVNFLDYLSSGGGREGDKWLILGSSGGGKTALAVQYACAQAMLGNDTLWATYEQSMEGDIAERMIANITDTSLDEIRDVGFVNLPQQIQDRFWASVSGVDDRLISLDMTKSKPDPQDPEDYGGVMSIWKQFNKLKEDHRKPKTVIIDWFGSMMSRIGANLGMDLSQCYRFKAQEEINTLIRFARTEKILIIVFHQLDIKAASARPTYLADATHAQDMHSLQNYFDMVIPLGVRDTHDVCYISSAKSRKGKRATATLRLIGDKSRFVMEDGWMPNRDGNFYRPGDTDDTSATEEDIDYARELE